MNADVVRKLLMRTVSDPYGRRLGRIVGFTVDPKKEVTALGIELTNGGLLCCPCTQISLENDTVIVDYPWRVEANQLGEEFTLICRKNSALDKLHNSGEVAQEVYDEMQKQNEATIREITKRCQNLSDDLKDRIEDLNTQAKELRTFLANVKIEHMVGNIDEEAYKVSSEILQTMLNQSLLEKRDVELALNNLSKNSMISQTTSPEHSRITSQPQPIVLRIKEAGS